MDWLELQTEIDTLTSKIDFKPDLIIGIVRGGVVPARLLATKLNIKEMYCLTIKKEGQERKVTSEILEDLTGKNVLLVEDMLETGKSLIVAKKYLEQKGAEVKTACLYTMPISEIVPDFLIREINKNEAFPWE